MTRPDTDQPADHFALSAPTVFDGEVMRSGHCIVVRDGLIDAVLPTADCPDDLPFTALPSGLLAPGFIDLQVNGGGDVLFNNAPTRATLRTMARAHRALGSTAIVPTLVSDTPEVLRAGVAAVAEAIAAGDPGILGIHIEGPFLAGARRGAHRADRVRGGTEAELDWLCTPRDFPVLVTLAPEQLATADIARLAAAGLIVCAGHSEASFEQVAAAVHAGLGGVTHLFNAMPPAQARAPGLAGAALSMPELWAGIIADGHHVHPAMLRLAHAAKPAGKLLLVSDAMATAGGERDRFTLYGEEIRLREGRLVNAEGRLAGSAIGLADAVRYAHRQAGLPLEDCLRMASRYPAAVLGIGQRRGQLAPGLRADIVHLDDALQPRHSWVGGTFAAHAHRAPAAGEW